MAQEFIWGNKMMGYSVEPTVRKKEILWLGLVWDRGRIARHDIFSSKSGAIAYLMGRKKTHYGRLSFEKAYAKFGGKR